jgi:hypothetical protein
MGIPSIASLILGERIDLYLGERVVVEMVWIGLLFSFHAKKDLAPEKR